MTHRIVHLWIAILLLITACQSAPPPPTAIPLNAAVAVNNTLIQWVRSPEAILFQADVTAGNRDTTLVGKRDVPLCTVYGDNRVVWVNELGPFNIEVLYDRIEDNVIGTFIAYLTVNERIYTYQRPDNMPEIDETAVVETIAINVNGVQHRADGFSGWDSEWFPRVLAACRSLSQSPVLFEPNGGWLTVENAPYDPLSPALTWNPAETGLDLAALAAQAEPSWVANAQAVTVWRLQNTQPPRFLLQQGDAYFAIALQVPGISRTAPPPPV
ncbi:MAG: hypothetical protein SF162_07360 [bacterium]|nr:hypothetical protein [bacterium]